MMFQQFHVFHATLRASTVLDRAPQTAPRVIALRTIDICPQTSVSAFKATPK